MLILIAIFALLGGLVHTVAAAGGAASDHIAGWLRDGFHDGLDPDRRAVYQKRADEVDRNQRGRRAGDSLAAEFMTEAMFRLPLDDYALTPLWRHLRRAMLLHFLLALSIAAASLRALVNRQCGTKWIIVSAVLLAAVAIGEALVVYHHFPRFLADLDRDMVVARQELAEEIDLVDRFGGDRLGRIRSIPRGAEMAGFAVGYALVVGGPWQVVALLAAFLTRRRVRAPAGES